MHASVRGEAGIVITHVRVCECLSVRKITHERVDGCHPNSVGMGKEQSSRTGYIFVLIRFRMWIQDHFSSFLSSTR